MPATAGYHLAVICTAPVDIPLLIALAGKVEVGLYALAPFYYQAEPKAGLLLGFGAIELLDIDTALDRVRDILQQIGPGI
ncbi:hypothetical protein D3C86_1964570 [compost metagenome]